MLALHNLVEKQKTLLLLFTRFTAFYRRQYVYPTEIFRKVLSKHQGYVRDESLGKCPWVLARLRSKKQGMGVCVVQETLCLVNSQLIDPDNGVGLWAKVRGGEAARQGGGVVYIHGDAV